MKTNQKIYIAVLAASLGIFACKRDLKERNMAFPALSPANADTGAGKWKPILLTKADEFAIDVPLAISSSDYKAELNEIKSWQARLSSEQRDNIKYWSAGAVLRWNEILRELVALHNLAPYQNDDGSYPVPSANNPFAYPVFPFANPPYAARAYAYVSAAQYDALVAAYHYKLVYRRPTPKQVDPTIQEMIPVAASFAYPSEDGVVAGASCELLKLLFPADQAWIQEKLEEHRQSRIMSGANVRSDFEAGMKLGKLVAQKFATRARGDKAGAAVGNQALWDQMATNTANKGEIPWISQESPKRPPMLPLFGNVKGFLMDSGEVVSGRPAPPPSTGSEQFKKETEEVKWYSEHSTRERMRIVHFWADGTGTYTPPGHWNAIACEDFVNQRYSEVRWARNLALLNMAMFQAAICCWDTKFFYFNPRPSQVDPTIKTLTGLPNFPSYTSGHSTFSGSAAEFLGHVIPSRAAAYNEMANEASVSRLYGAIHYRSDIEVGMSMGKMIGQKAIARAQTDGAE
ncbi:MAG: phosphatase PAP2 family protein [Bacteroidetes bacterium]|nr:phosphatase PAP2 family protein [Bacteroidota bacterium]